VDVVNKLNKLRRQENQCWTASSIKFSLRFFQEEVPTVTYKNGTGHILEAASKEEMEEVVTVSNKWKILQAQNIYFMQEMLESEVGWLVVGSISQYILSGYYLATGALSAFTVKRSTLYQDWRKNMQPTWKIRIITLHQNCGRILEICQRTDFER
jgi:hypothetical protein